jgi:hypothetical protein
MEQIQRLGSVGPNLFQDARRCRFGPFDHVGGGQHVLRELFGRRGSDFNQNQNGKDNATEFGFASRNSARWPET